MVKHLEDEKIMLTFVATNKLMKHYGKDNSDKEDVSGI